MFKNLLRGILLVIAVLVLALPTFAQTGDIFRVTAQSLNARTGPGIEYDIVARLGRGGSYPIVQYSPTANWVLLDLGVGQAWAFRHLGEISSSSVVPAVANTVVINAGQGGGFPAPVTTFTAPPQQAAPVTTYTYTYGQGSTYTVPLSSLGQGGGFIPAVSETGVDLTVMSSQADFNSTIGVTGTLRMRAEPTFSSRIVSAIPYDQRATPIGRNTMGTWIQVNYQGTVGWVYFLYVSFPPSIPVVNLPVTG